jgi:hypothetical protein
VSSIRTTTLAVFFIQSIHAMDHYNVLQNYNFHVGRERLLPVFLKYLEMKGVLGFDELLL